jgi:uncharacterized coiled-coil protein SlyX
MNRETIVPSIPDIRDDNVKDVLRAIKNVLDVREGNVGDPLDQLVTMRELNALNLADKGSSATSYGGTLPVAPVLVRPPGGYDPTTDFTTPPQPTGLIARGGLTNVYLQWDGAPMRNIAYTEVWRATTDNLGAAVLVGTTVANVYADPVAPDTVYFYWIRFVSQANITGPYNSTSGTRAQTAFDVATFLPALQNEISNSQLFLDLGTRVSRVELSSSLTADDIAFLKSSQLQFQDLLSKNGSAILTTQKVTASQATLITQLGTRVGNAESNITSLQSTTATQATSLSTLSTRVGAAESNITTLQTTTSNQATSISNLSSTVSGQSTTISTQQTTINGLSGQYTVKIDNNGHVSGFGLASSAVNGTPTSAFIVRADRFAIAGANDATDPLGTLTPTKVPFIVLTTPTTVNGKTYPAGTWIDTAFIANATIGTAQISDLTADKITTGTLTASISVDTGKIYGGVAGTGLYPPGHSFFGTGFFMGNWSGTYQFYVGSPSKYVLWDGSNLKVAGQISATGATFQGLTITDGSGNVLLGSGQINGAYITGLTASRVSGLGTLATQNSVSSSQVSGLGSLATQDNVFVGSTVRFADGTVMNTGDFVNRLSQINSSNISTFIASAAIGDAYIGNLNASKITAGTISADRLDSGIITAKVANLQSAQLAGNIQSDNYVANSSGWLIRRTDGFAEFQNVRVRGDVQANSVTANSITTNSIQGQNVTQAYQSSSAGTVVSVTVVVPDGATAAVILAGLGSGYWTGGGEGSGSYFPNYGDLYVSGAIVVNNSASNIVYSYQNPPAGTYTVQVYRNTAVGTMTLAVLVLKR